MRAFFFMLLAANLVYLVWGLAHPPERPAHLAPEIPASAERLVLWAEYHGGTTGGVTNSVDDGLKTVASGSTANAVADSGQPGNDVAPAPPAEDGTNPRASTRSCYTLGPFAVEDATRQVVNDLAGLEVEAAVRETRKRRPTSYWVYLAGFNDRAQAQETVNDLKAGGVKDYYIETVGEYRNTISLGLYTYRSRAAIRADNIRELGFDPQIRPNLRNVAEFWIDFEIRAGVELAPAWWRDTVTDPDAIEQKERDCS